MTSVGKDMIFHGVKCSFIPHLESMEESIADWIEGQNPIGGQIEDFQVYAAKLNGSYFRIVIIESDETNSAFGVLDLDSGLKSYGLRKEQIFAYPNFLEQIPPLALKFQWEIDDEVVELPQTGQEINLEVIHVEDGFIHKVKKIQSVP